MKNFELTLAFELHDKAEDPALYVDALGETGCDDAIIGVGKVGRIGFSFVREAQSEKDAISSAIQDIKSVIPDAKLIEIR
jgi:hypothetical protein